MSRKLKEIHQKLDALQDQVREVIERMEDIYDHRTEKWCEGEKGEEWAAKIELLNEVHENLDNAGGGLLEVLGEL